VSEETVDGVRDAFQSSPPKSTCRAPHELRIPKSTVVKMLYKRLRLCAYKVQLVEALEPDDDPQRAAFATGKLQRIDEANDYLTRVCFF
jgi:hypothetical protein